MPDTYVLDCSVAAKWFLPEPDRAAALTLFEQYAAGKVSLIAPDLLLAEFSSLLAKRCRRKQLSAVQARSALGLMTQSAPRLLEMRTRLPRSLDLSLQYQMSLWDCVYVALALERNCAVLTADLRFFRAGGDRGLPIRMLQQGIAN